MNSTQACSSSRRVIFTIGLIFWSIVKLSASPYLVKTAHMLDSETRQFSHIHWASYPSKALTLNIINSSQMTGKKPFSISEIKGNNDDVEIRTLPNKTEHLLAGLIAHGGYFTISNQLSAFKIQLNIKHYNSLYSIGETNRWFNRLFAQSDRGWSKIHGDDKAASVSISLVLYDENNEALVEVFSSAELNACERATTPTNFPPNQFQTFFNAYATSTSGQALIASINRGLLEIYKYFNKMPIETHVIQVRDNDIFIDVGEKHLQQGQILKLLYPTNHSEQDQRSAQVQLHSASHLTRYEISRLVVEDTLKDYSIVHAIDTHPSNIIRGDRVIINRTIPLASFKSVAGQPINCIKPKDNFSVDFEKLFSWSEDIDEDQTSQALSIPDKKSEPINNSE